MAPARARVPLALLALLGIASATRLGGVGAADRDAASALAALPARLGYDLLLEVLGFPAFRYHVASSGGSDVVLWGPGGPRRRLGHGAPVVDIAFAGDRLLSWGTDGCTAVWEMPSGRRLRRLCFHGEAAHARVLQGGGWILTVSTSNSTVLWHAASGTALRVFATPEVHRVEVLGTGEHFLTWGRLAPATVWHLPTGDRRCEFRSLIVPVVLLSVFPGGDRAVSGALGRAAIWSTATCAAQHVLETPSSSLLIEAAVIDAGRVLAILSLDGRIDLWSTASGARLRGLDSQRPQRFSYFLGLRALPGSDLLAAFSAGEVVLWNATAGAVLHRLRSAPLLTLGVAVSPRGDLLATCDARRATVWDPASGARLHDLRPSPGLSASSPCAVAIGWGRASDPVGFGLGASWLEAGRE